MSLFCANVISFLLKEKRDKIAGSKLYSQLHGFLYLNSFNPKEQI